MDAIKFILNEHAQIRNIITKTNSEENPGKIWPFFEELKLILLRHEKMEEELWYPSLKKIAHLNDIVDHLINEEKKAETMIKKLNKGNLDEEWKKGFRKLVEDVLHHANEEETKLFPAAKKALSSEVLDALGKELKNFAEQAKHIRE